MNEYTLKKFFKEECKIPIKYLDNGLILDWLEKNYPTFLEEIKFSDYTLPEIFYLDFIICYNQENYTVFFTADYSEVQYFIKSYSISEIAKDFINTFNIKKQLLFYYNYRNSKPNLEKFFDCIEKNYDKSFIWISL